MGVNNIYIDLSLFHWYLKTHYLEATKSFEMLGLEGFKTGVSLILAQQEMNNTPLLTDYE